MAIENTVYIDFLIRVRRLLRAFSIAAYPVWLIFFHNKAYFLGKLHIIINNVSILTRHRCPESERTDLHLSCRHNMIFVFKTSSVSRHDSHFVVEIVSCRMTVFILISLLHYICRSYPIWIYAVFLKMTNQRLVGQGLNAR